MYRLLYLADRIAIHDRRFLRKFVEAGCHVSVVVLGGAGAVPAEPGVQEWHGLDLDWDRSDAADREAATDRLKRLAESLAPQVIQAGPIDRAAYLAAWAGLRPLCAMSLGYDVLWEPARDADTACRVRHALRQSDLLLADCEAVITQCRAWDALPPSQVRFPFGIDLAVAEAPSPLPLPAEWPDDAFVLLSLRNWESLYAPDVLLDAFALARARNPRLRLILAGDGSLRPALAERIARPDLAGSVWMKGRYSPDSLPSLTAAADLYLSCARTDGSSVSLLEAMGASLPVLATALDSNREWVEEGVNGWLAPADLPAGFAEKLLAAASLSEEDRRKMGIVSRRKIEADADWHRNFPRLIEAHRRLARLPHDPLFSGETGLGK